ncbi:MAG TPA: hypothetical protein VEO95_05750, partial [Chthoniobacteraceae bacterium]|nr:hypothetical protein [Chthoniobacteraceae bacterium]
AASTRLRAVGTKTADGAEQSTTDGTDNSDGFPAEPSFCLSAKSVESVVKIPGNPSQSPFTEI